jgi:hypothetical protein
LSAEVSQPLLPCAKKPPSWTNKYARSETQTTIAALEIAAGKVVAPARNRRTRGEFPAVSGKSEKMGFDPASCPTQPRSSFHAYRRLRRWIPLPQVIYAVSARS